MYQDVTQDDIAVTSAITIRVLEALRLWTEDNPMPLSSLFLLSYELIALAEHTTYWPASPTETLKRTEAVLERIDEGVELERLSTAEKQLYTPRLDAEHPNAIDFVAGSDDDDGEIARFTAGALLFSLGYIYLLWRQLRRVPSSSGLNISVWHIGTTLLNLGMSYESTPESARHWVYHRRQLARYLPAHARASRDPDNPNGEPQMFGAHRTPETGVPLALSAFRAPTFETGQSTGQDRPSNEN